MKKILRFCKKKPVFREVLSGNRQKEGAKKKYNDSCKRSKGRLSSHPFIFVSMFLTKMDFFEGGGLKYEIHHSQSVLIDLDACCCEKKHDGLSVTTS